MTHEGPDLARSKKVGFWGWVEICGRICARGGRQPASGEIRSRSRVSVSKTRGTRIVIVDQALNNPPSTLHRARVDPGFLYRRAGLFLPCFSILSSASDEIWTFSAVSTCGESPVAA